MKKKGCPKSDFIQGQDWVDDVLFNLLSFLMALR
jgi:hypothetical protein